MTQYPKGGSGMRLPNGAHTSRPWRIHELTRDFRLEDVWALPTPGGRDDFPRLVQAIASGDPSQGAPRAVRALWATRWKLGKLLGWDGPDAGLGSRVPTLRDRLPADLREAPSGPDFAALPFRSLYLLDDEWAAEIANRTMHGVMHLGWVPDGTDGYRGQMAVLVRPNGLLGAAYMAAIRPFRYLIVYPAAIRRIEREWRACAAIEEGRRQKFHSRAPTADGVPTTVWINPPKTSALADLIEHGATLLRGIRLQSSVYFRPEFRAPWGIRIAARSTTFHIISSGHCLLQFKGTTSLSLSAGDFVVDV